MDEFNASDLLKGADHARLLRLGDLVRRTQEPEPQFNKKFEKIELGPAIRMPGYRDTLLKGGNKHLLMIDNFVASVLFNPASDISRFIQSRLEQHYGCKARWIGSGPFHVYRRIKASCRVYQLKLRASEEAPCRDEHKDPFGVIYINVYMPNASYVLSRLRPPQPTTKSHLYHLPLFKHIFNTKPFGESDAEYQRLIQLRDSSKYYIEVSIDRVQAQTRFLKFASTRLCSTPLAARAICGDAVQSSLRQAYDELLNMYESVYRAQSWRPEPSMSLASAGGGMVVRVVRVSSADPPIDADPLEFKFELNINDNRAIHSVHSHSVRSVRPVQSADEANTESVVNEAKSVYYMFDDKNKIAIELCRVITRTTRHTAQGTYSPAIGRSASAAAIAADPPFAARALVGVVGGRAALSAGAPYSAIDVLRGTQGDRTTQTEVQDEIKYIKIFDKHNAVIKDRRVRAIIFDDDEHVENHIFIL